MATELITRADLERLRLQLLEDLKLLLQTPEKKWLKGSEVRRLLGISAGTLQTLRVNGTLPASRIGGTLYYRYQDIDKLMNKTSLYDT